MARARRAVLLIAKLDRLSRNLHFLTGLMDAGVEFVCADNPHANKLTIHVLAAMAQYEAEMISQRTKAALQAAKARGVKLGGIRGANHHYATDEDRRRSAQVSRAQALRRAHDLKPVLDDMVARGITTQKDIALELNRMGVPGPRGGKWWGTSVGRYRRRLRA